MADSTTHKLLFSPGETCVASGLYQVMHSCDRAHERLAFRHGSKFPECSACKSKIRYLLLVHAPQIFDEQAA